MAKGHDVDFQAAASHHDELSDTQLEVLEFIAGGLTNGEIADSLGISLDGAKWNVSEILTKLGLPRREDAAAYYRWHRSPMRRVGRHSRALVMGAAGVVAMVAAVAVVAVGPSSGEAAGTPGAFYLESMLEHGNTGGSGAGTEDTVIRTIMRQWFEPPNVWRIELEPLGDSDRKSSTYFFDGSDMITLDVRENTFLRGAFRAPEGWDGVPWFAPTPLIGRVPGEDAADFLEVIKRRRGTAVLRRSEELNGRPVVVIEQERPAQCPGGPPLQIDADTVLSAEEGCTVTLRLWLDEERMLVLRAESWLDAEEYREAFAEVTSYKDDVRHEPALFIPPPGAVDVTEETPFGGGP
jgi:DNA-binding CsgD family transcriptional regulator